ncbi:MULTISPECIES: Gfo/Idh/MocA family protein [Solibacillus]|uniref:Gfo/Idh/MocA family oxidoreductase n=1 Tax=Solibacillus merdavium TaxID=2762218 RepID=A0ABR8XRC1_9BACL|nr:Gfo/Idh/MocA family oxidoreductase [Solibacillus merdavium]MBD8034419.1 Gfo/Idh/MocA family oxidoreductase [Solibacillus merdavium]
MLKVGVIGGGSISEFHLRPYFEHPNVEIIAICDTNEVRLQGLGKKYLVKNLYTEVGEFLANEQIDAVSICTWNNSHADIAIQALQKNKHVLLEKPMSLNLEEAYAVEAAVKESKKILQVGNVRRFGTNVKVLKKFIDAGELGEIYYAKASCLRRLGNPGGWFSDISKSGGGPLIDLGTHMIDLCWYLMGKPKPVSVSGNTYRKLGNRAHIENLSFYKAADYNAEHNDVEDLANGLIRFENGASLFVDVSFTLHSKQDEISVKLYGENGGAEVEPELTIIKEQHETILNITPQIDLLSFDFAGSFVNEINHFIDCCINNVQPISPVSDGVEVTKMLLAIYESAATNREIKL